MSTTYALFYDDATKERLSRFHSLFFGVKDRLPTLIAEAKAAGKNVVDIPLCRQMFGNYLFVIPRLQSYKALMAACRDQGLAPYLDQQNACLRLGLPR